MTVVVGMMFMAASVTAVSVALMQNGYGVGIYSKCMSLQNVVAVDVLVTVAKCNTADPKQTNWEIIRVGRYEGKDKFSVCIKGTNLCAGYKQVGNDYEKQQQLLKRDDMSLGQQWVLPDGSPKSRYNLGAKLCDVAVNGFIEGRECKKDVENQMWTRSLNS